MTTTVKNMLDQLKRIEDTENKITENFKNYDGELTECIVLLDGYRKLILKQPVQLEDGRKTSIDATLKTADDIEKSIKKLKNHEENDSDDKEQLIKHLTQYRADILCRQLT